MSDDLNEFLKSEYVPKNLIRYIKIRLSKERQSIVATWNLDLTDDTKRVDEIDAILEVLDDIIKS